MKKRLLKIITFFVYLSLFTPIIISNKVFFPYVGPKSLFFLFCAQAIFFSYLLLNLYSSEYRPKINILSISLGVFLIVFALSSFFGIDFQQSFWSKYERMTGLLTMLHLFGYFVAISSVFKKREDWMKIFGVSVFVATLISLGSILEKMGISLIGTNSRGGFTLGNSSFLGTYLLFNFFFALYLFFKTNPQKFHSDKFKLFNFLALLSAGLMGLTLWFSEARAALLCTMGGAFLIFLLWMAFSKIKILKYIGISFLAIGILMGVSALFVSVSNPSLVEEKLTERFGSSAIRPRFETYEMSWKALEERPLLGWGPGNFDIVFTEYFNPKFFTEEYGDDIWYDKAHNIVFDTLVESGILGLLSYLFIFASLFYFLWKSYFRNKIGFWELSVFSALPSAYFIQNLTVFDMISSYAMFFLVLGFIGSINNTKEEMTSERKANSSFLVFLIVGLFFFSFFFSVFQPLRKGNTVIMAITKRPFSEEKLDYYKKGVSFSPIGQDQVREFFADSTIKFARDEEISRVPKSDVIRELDFVAEEVKKSIERSPWNYRMFLKLGKIYNTYFYFDNSKVVEAEKYLKEAIELSPNNQQGYWNLAQTKLFQKEVDQAIALAEKAVALEPNALRSHLVLIQVVRYTGDMDVMREKMENALSINMEWEEKIAEALGVSLEE